MSSANDVQRVASIQQVLATSLDWLTVRAQHTRKAAARVRQRTANHTVWTPLRGGLGIVGGLAPLVMLTGFGIDLHDLSWFVYYGFSSTDFRLGDAAPDAPAWLAWVIVAALALRWRRTAAVAAWLATAGMVVALTTGAMLPTAQTGGWLLLAVLASCGLTFSPAAFRGLRDIGLRRTLSVCGAVVLVLFARLLGHQFTAVYALAWIALGVAVAYASRPATTSGRWSLLLLGVPAGSAILAMVAVDQFAFNIYRPSTPWPVVIFVLYGLPVLAVAALVGVLRHCGRLPDHSRT